MRLVGWPGLVFSFLAFFVLGVFGKAGYLFIATGVFAIAVAAWGLVKTQPTTDPPRSRKGSGERTDRIATGFLWFGMVALLVNGAVITASWADNIRAGGPAVLVFAGVALPFCIMAVAISFRREEFAGEASATYVWSLEDDGGYMTRRWLARCVDLVLVGVGAVFLELTDWWTAHAPSLGIESGREFLAGMTVLVAYDGAAGYARGSVGKRVFGLRLRAVPDLKGIRVATWPLLRVAAFVVIGGAGVVAVLVSERSGSTEAQVLAGMAFLPLLLSALIHPEAQTLYDAVAGCYVGRRRQRVPAEVRRI